MMRLKLCLVFGIAVLSGCASGPKYSDIKSSIPAVDPAAGRIYFYRSSALGAAIQPNILLNGEVVGEMVPHGFFFVDRAPGNYVVSARTESEATLEVSLQASQTQYVRGAISIGIFVGRPDLSLVDKGNALVELDDLSYIGTVALVPGSAGAGPEGAAAAGGVSSGSAPPPPAGTGSGTTSLKELEGLLPGKEPGK